MIPDKTTLSYRLVGFDDNWQTIEAERQVVYNNLGPGSYRFEVTASDELGRFSGKTTHFEFVVLPTFFETWAFYLLCVLALAGAGFSWHHLRLRNLRRREQELENRVDETVARLKVLSGLLPICASCKRIRDDTNKWEPLETFIHDHSEASFSHGLCPDCTRDLYGTEIAAEVQSLLNPKPPTR